MAKKFAVIHTINNYIVAIVEGVGSVTAARHADRERSLSGRDFKEVPTDQYRADIEYNIYELDATDVKIFSDRDRFVDDKYTRYVTAHCKKVASLIVA